MVTILGWFVAVGTVLYLLASIVKVVKTCTDALNNVIDELRGERTLLHLEKKILHELNLQITLQRQIIDRQLTMAMNSLTAMKLIEEKRSEPEWVRKFEQGRDNAQYN